MDSKIVCVTLLLIVFCLWSVEASPLEALDLEKSKEIEDFEKGYSADDDYRSEVHQKKAVAAGILARNYANKAKSKGSEAGMWSQMAKVNLYHANAMKGLAQDMSKHGMGYEQQSASDASRVGHHNARQKDLESKARESETMAKNQETRNQQLYSEINENRKKSVDYKSQAAQFAAMATGHLAMAQRLYNYVEEMKNNAERSVSYAKNHYIRGKEDEAKANAEKVRSHNYAEDSQNHLATSRKYENDYMQHRLARQANVMRYIYNAVMAERNRNYGKEEKLKSQMHGKIAQSCAQYSQQDSNIAKISSSQYGMYVPRIKHYETRSMINKQASNELTGELTQEAGSQIKNVEVNNDEKDGYPNDNLILSSFGHDDPVKAMPSEEKNSMMYDDHGL